MVVVGGHLAWSSYDGREKVGQLEVGGDSGREGRGSGKRLGKDGVGKGKGAGRDGGVDVVGDDSSPDMGDREQHRRHELAGSSFRFGCHLRVRRRVSEQHSAAEALDSRSSPLQKRQDIRPRAVEGSPGLSS